MYTKLFTKILDSSVWLESVETRLVWFTFLASMDEDGFCPFASAANVANRARISLADTQAAIDKLEAPDPDSSDPEFEGRRIERIEGGWIVLNAAKYRMRRTRAMVRADQRERAKRYRERKRAERDGTPLPREALPKPIQKKFPPPLIDGRGQRGHGEHAYCGNRLCVTRSLHDDLVKRLGTSDASDQLLAWYPTVLEKYRGRPFGDNLFEFWRNEFAAWVGTVTTKPGSGGKGTATKSVLEQTLAKRAAKRAKGK